MNTRLLFHSRWYCLKINNVRYLSNLHATVSNDSFINHRQKMGKNVDRDGSVYVKNSEVANSIASYIANEWNGGYFFEANPGPGILSSSLLQKGINHLRLFEKNKYFLPALEVLKDECPVLEVVQQDLLLIPSYELKQNLDKSSWAKEYFDIIFKDIPVCSWEKETSFQIFAVIANKRSHKFLRYLLFGLPNEATLFSFGRCDIFLLVSETELMCMTAQPKENLLMYRWSTVLYNIFYNIKCLQKFPADSKNFYNAVMGWREKMQKRPYVWLIKLTPKSDIFNPPMTLTKLQELFFFVQSNFSKRSDLVIKTMESWMPFCGPRLIKEGFNVFTRFGDLSPAEIFKLFTCISSWSEYQNKYTEAVACKFCRKKEEDSSIE